MKFEILLTYISTFLSAMENSSTKESPFHETKELSDIFVNIDKNNKELLIDDSSIGIINNPLAELDESSLKIIMENSQPPLKKDAKIKKNLKLTASDDDPSDSLEYKTPFYENFRENVKIMRRYLEDSPTQNVNTRGSESNYSSLFKICQSIKSDIIEYDKTSEQQFLEVINGHINTIYNSLISSKLIIDGSKSSRCRIGFASKLCLNS